MNLKVYEDSNYSCQVFTIKNISKVENADRLQKVVHQGNATIVGLTAKEGDKYLFFPLEAALSVKFMEANNLLRKKDAEGKNIGGLFEPHGRIKAITFRGVKVEGFICPATHLDGIGIDSSKLKEGDVFNEIDGIEICRKYVVKKANSVVTRSQGKQPKIESKIIEGQYYLQYDTSQLKRNLSQFKLNDTISITSKIHGTNMSLGRVLCKKEAF